MTFGYCLADMLKQLNLLTTAPLLYLTKCLIMNEQPPHLHRKNSNMNALSQSIIMSLEYDVNLVQQYINDQVQDIRAILLINY